MAGPADRDIIVEFVRLGAYLRCAAVDTETGIEATAIGPHNTDQRVLQKIAIGKLMRALAEQKS
jgi:hypothetical protein